MKDEYASLMKCATPTAITTRRVVPRETRIVLDPARLVTGMPGGYRPWCIRATRPMGLETSLAAGLDPPYG